MQWTPGIVLDPVCAIDWYVISGEAGEPLVDRDLPILIGVKRVEQLRDLFLFQRQSGLGQILLQVLQVEVLFQLIVRLDEPLVLVDERVRPVAQVRDRLVLHMLHERLHIVLYPLNVELVARPSPAVPAIPSQPEEEGRTQAIEYVSSNVVNRAGRPQVDEDEHDQGRAEHLHHRAARLPLPIDPILLQ